MKELYKIIYVFILLNLVKNAEVINSCGKIGYDEPNENDCQEKGEYCCFVEIQINSETRKYCVTSPSEIEKDDVKDEIEKYTDGKLLRLKCNISHFINNSLIKLLILCLFF